jgi:hypothetical protein
LAGREGPGRTRLAICLRATGYGQRRAVHFFAKGELGKMTTMDVSDALERIDNIINMLDEVCDHTDCFSSAEEAWLSSITETLRTWRYVM